MKNYEKYADEIRGYNGDSICTDFIHTNILKSTNCRGMDCTKCHMLQMLWLLENYEEPEVDWSKVEVDTPILVRRGENEEWNKRYFAGYGNDGYIYAWDSGCTSWTTGHMTAWNFAKLAESEECKR